MRASVECHGMCRGNMIGAYVEVVAFCNVDPDMRRQRSGVITFADPPMADENARQGMPCLFRHCCGAMERGHIQMADQEKLVFGRKSRTQRTCKWPLLSGSLIQIAQDPKCLGRIEAFN